MLFTNIQLDDFSPTLAHLLERLSIEEPEAREWIVMAAINIGILPNTAGHKVSCDRRANVLGVPSHGLALRFSLYTVYSSTVGYIVPEYKWCKTTPGRDNFV
jgi:hypothetical protein